MGEKEQVDEIMQEIQSKLADYLDSHPPLSAEEAARRMIAEEYGVQVSAVEVDLESGTAHVTLPTPCEKLAFEVVVR